MFEQCKWFITFPKKNWTSKFLNWYMSQDNYDKNPWKISSFGTRIMESFILVVLLSSQPCWSFPAITSSSCMHITQIAFLSQEGAVFQCDCKQFDLDLISCNRRGEKRRKHRKQMFIVPFFFFPSYCMRCCQFKLSEQELKVIWRL